MYNYARIFYNENDYFVDKFDISSYHNTKQILKDIIEFNKLDKEEFNRICKEVCNGLNLIF